MPAELEVPEMVMLLLLIVLLLAVTAVVLAVRHCMVVAALGAAGVLLLPVMVLLFIARVVGAPPDTSSMDPVPVAVLFVTVLVLRFTVPAEAVLTTPENDPVVAAEKAQFDTVLPVRFTVAADAEFTMPLMVLVVVVALLSCTVLPVMVTVLPAAVEPMPLSMPVTSEEVEPLARVTVLPVMSMLAEGPELP